MMTEEFDSLSATQEQPSRNNTVLIVLIVIVLLLSCLCLLVGGFAVWWLWNYGDYLLGISMATVRIFV
jgi:uncharacterized Tic20 family protein